MARRTPWVWCREPGCDTKLTFASRNGRRLPYEYADQTPFSDASTGCHVLVAGQAMTPGEAIEDFRVRFEIDEDRARETVAGFPFHRRHIHEPTNQETP